MCPESANDLAMRHIDLIDTVVRSRGRDPWLRDDLRQEAFIGLLSAARRFDDSRECSFQTFALRRMRGAVQDYLRNFPHPEHRRESRRSVEATATDAGWEWSEALRNRVSREPNPLDAAASRDEVRHILRYLGPRARFAMSEHCLSERMQKDLAVDIGVTASRVNQIIRTSRETIVRRNGIAR